jgi:hypothetical protein
MLLIWIDINAAVGIVKLIGAFGAKGISISSILLDYRFLNEIRQTEFEKTENRN